jgi:ectoine hydroxylase
VAKGPLNDDQLHEYQANGFVLVRRMFDEEETGLLRRAAKEDRKLDQHSYGRGDGEGGIVRLSLWNHPGNTLYGMFARSESIVNSAEKLLGGEVYHYQSKIVVTPETVVRWHRAGFSSSTGMPSMGQRCPPRSDR